MKRALSPLTQKEPSVTSRKGFSSVEALLAAAIFALLVTALMGSYLYGQEATMLAGNRARATMLAEEGLEAPRNIRDASFSNLIDGTFGITTTANQWNLSGAPDVTDIFTRQVTVATVDANTKDLTSTVTWQQNASRTGTVTLVTRLTNWLAAVASAGGGLFIYGDGTTTPKVRDYTQSTDVFGAQGSTILGTSGNAFVLKTSPTKREAIAGYVNSVGVLRVMCYDGTTWTNEWTVTVGGTATTRRFDIAYETTTGKAMVVYSTNAITTNELAYRTKLGSTGCGGANWAAATNINPARTASQVHWVKMTSNPVTASNLIALAWIDGADDLSTMIWSGSAWGNEPTAVTDSNVQRVAASHDVDDYDLEYASVSGDLMLVWGTTVGAGANGARYRRCVGGSSSCLWGAVSTPGTFLDDATSLDLSVNPNTNDMVFASVGLNQSDLQIGFWNGTTNTWTNTANADTSCNPPLAGSYRVQTGWLISGGTTRSVVVYGDQGSNNLDWYVGNAGTFTKQTDKILVPAPNAPNNSIDVQMDPLNKNQLMYTIGDSSGQLLAKRLSMDATPVFTWTNSDAAVLVGTLPQTIVNPFAFTYWKQ